MDARVDIDLNINDNGASNTVGSLKAQLRQAQAEVALLSDQFGATSVEAANAARKAAELADRIGDAKLLTDAFNPDAKFKALSNSIGGVLNGFQAYQGALGLMGADSKEFEQILLKVQSAMALTQGINGVLESKDAFKTLGAVIKNTFAEGTAASKAFLATGIGLLIAGIGLLIANWDDLTAAMSSQTAKQKVLNDVTKQAYTEINKEVSAADKLGKELKSENLTRAEKIRKVKEFQAQYPTLLSNINTEKDSIKDINEQLRKNIKLLELQATAKAIQAVRAEKLQSKLNTQIELQSQAQENATNWTLTFGSSAENGFVGFNTAAENAAIATKDFNKIQNTTTKGLDKQIKSLDQASSAIDKQIEALEKQGAKIGEVDKKQKDSTKSFEDKADAIARIREAEKEYNDQSLSDIDVEKNAVNDKYKELIDLAKKYGQDTSTLEDAQKNEINNINLKYEQIRLDKIEADNKEKDKLAKEEYDKEQQLLKDHYDKQDEIDAFRRSLQADGYSKDLDELVAQYDKKFELAYGNAQLELEVEEAFKRDKAAIDDKYRKEKEQKDKDSADKEKQLRFDTIQAGLQMAQSAVSILSSIFEGQTAKNEREARKQFRINKALNLSTAGINTALAVTAALAQTKEIFPGQRFIEAALVGAAGLVQITKIANTQFGGFNPGPNNENQNTNRSLQANFNPNTFQSLGTSKIPSANGNTDTKVYVVESDITNVQNKVSVIESRSYLGG